MREPFSGASCHRMPAEGSGLQQENPQLEATIAMLTSRPGEARFSLTRKRSLVQSQYRPPAQLTIFECMLVAQAN
jgi:hypothetical protein